MVFFLYLNYELIEIMNYKIETFCAQGAQSFLLRSNPFFTFFG